MKRVLVVMLALMLFSFSYTKQTEASLMPLDGSWTVIDEAGMVNGDFFTGNWSWNTSYAVAFDITDLYVVTDVYEVYDNGALVFSTPMLPDYVALGIGAFTSPPYTVSADVAWTTPEFSKGSWVFAAGAHDITIKDIRIPTSYTDGTVAFRASAVPEPSTILLLASGFISLGFVRRKFKI